MNIHHLELFYYVAKHGGISEAVRNIPYGIQQPAVSAQILQLEDSLGVMLFHRRPFALTPPGEKLYKFIQPFFTNLRSVSEEIRGGTAHQIRIGASQIVLRDHLPKIMQIVRKQYPKLKLILREGYQAELEALLQKQEVDVVMTLLESKPLPGINALTLLQLPLVLVVSKKSKIKTAEELWKRERIEESLLCLPANEALCKTFQQGLAKIGVEWFPGIELTSLDLIETYVENGYGIGLSVALPNGGPNPNVSHLPLNGFPPVNFGLLWTGKPTALVSAFIDTVKQRAESLQASANSALPH